MRVKLMIAGAAALVALSAGVPGLLGGGDPESRTRSVSLDVQIVPEDESVVVTLQLDPDAPVVEVSLWSEATDLFFMETGEEGRWVAVGDLLHDVSCYPATAQVTLATVGAAPATPIGKVKKAKKVKAKKAHAALAATEAGKVKKVKAKKHKGSSPGFEAVMGALVLEVTAESCLHRSQDCEEIMN